ncbi:unnamed protein product [Dibothriocephalus latus]|uniref:Uncharacterized protein n=1 Tax=Dibothriocephalus latus TaxID=60516 RepID=A0A3P7M5Y3_DIBLA|nr:unnamed protein product [Dibothriocephalus latus]
MEEKLTAVYRNVLGSLQNSITRKEDLKAGEISYEELRCITYIIPDVCYDDFLHALEQIKDSIDDSKISISTFVSRISKLASILATCYAKAKTSCLQPSSTAPVGIVHQNTEPEKRAPQANPGLIVNPFIFDCTLDLREAIPRQQWRAVYSSTGTMFLSPCEEGQRPACQFQSFVISVVETKEFEICLTSSTFLLISGFSECKLRLY